MLMVTNIIGLLVNLCDFLSIELFGIFRPSFAPDGKSHRGISLTTVQFFIQAPIYFICLMFALVSYNNLRQEWCFHCKYGFFILQSLSLIFVTFLMLESLPWRSFLAAFLIFCLVSFVRQTGIEERKKNIEKKKRMKEAQEEMRRIDREG